MDEDARAYIGLLGILREAGLGWVSDEIEETVREGDVDIHALPAREIRVLYPDAEVSAGRVMAVDRRAYSSAERLAVAVAALRRVTVETSAMEREIRQSLGDRVFVADDVEGAEREALLADQSDRLANVERLTGLLRALSEPAT